jgi:hypothetical protein
MLYILHKGRHKKDIGYGLRMKYFILNTEFTKI